MRTFPKPAAQQNLRFGKRLGGEIYVASEASATPLQSYAPQSNFSGLPCVALPWTWLSEMLSSALLRVAKGLRRGHSPFRRIAGKRLISDGISP
jgi:hypothetical protein